MGVKLVAGVKMRAGDEDCDFANGPRQCRRGGEDFDKLPDWAAEFRVMQPGVPWPDQSTVAADGFKAFEIAFDTLSHVIIELALFGAEVGRGNEREAHQIFSSVYLLRVRDERRVRRSCFPSMICPTP